ncbi:HPr family phosphocarrier protein [Fidelibacter multiformis]|jgi:phosphocarrier protein|uniref:HPr family phosphocarrier protein n=1 Tax=Fidelibacter multiformis TaxID=3377529 RepID=UPI0037DC7CE5
MTEAEFQIINKQGLHARPATALVTLASKFSSNIFLSRGEKRINAKSILGILVLAAEKGATLKVQADGEDEEEAVKAIVELAKNKFGMTEE